VGSGPGPISAALSARQRKQVYLHSAIFDPKGVPPQSLYSQGKQQSILGQVELQRHGQPRAQCMVLPSPADLKATANQGHGVIAWDTPLPNSSRCDGASCTGQEATFMRFGEAGDAFKVVKANKEATGAIQREFSTLDWADQRCETLRILGSTQVREERTKLDASTRKMQDMSSEVLGNQRRLEKSTQHASQEIAAVPMLNVHSVDSSAQPRLVAMSPRNAKEYREKNLTSSTSSQFCRGDVAWQHQDGAQSARVATREDVGRRRSDRNYSDIFGADARGAAPPANASLLGVGGASSPKLLRRANEGVRAAGRVDVDGGESVIYRPHVSARLAAMPEQPQEPVLPVTPRCAPLEEACPRTKRVQAEERACWDTRVGMDLGAEIARRSRASRAHEGAELRSASERKAQELGSRNLRSSGFGGGAGGSQAAEESLRRVASASPMAKGGSYRNLHHTRFQDMASARGRKISSMQSSIIF